MQTLNFMEHQFSDFNAFRLFESSTDESRKRGLMLLEQLQTTLDKQKLINKFAMEASKYVDFSGLYFKSEDLEITMRGSRKGKIERPFTLHVNNQILGTLSYSLNKTISTASYKILTELHHYLVHPLNNAIQYHHALQLAMQDSLTGLGNRRYFDEQLIRAMHHSARQHSLLGLVVCDLNKFKAINDNHGHPVGDQVLIHFAEALRLSVRDSDSIFRFGGDEFAIIVEAASRESLEVISHRIHRNVASNYLLSQYQVTSSLGATFMRRNETGESFFNRADQALYQKKMNMPCKLSVV